MRRRTLRAILLGLALPPALYLALWPVPVDPVAWEAPPNPGHIAQLAPNDTLTGAELIDLGDLHGPEDVAVDAAGRVYASTREGWIVRIAGDRVERWVNTGGQPLGIELDAEGRLLVADAYRGLLRVAPDGAIETLATKADGIPIRYADDLDVAADGRIFFTDASTKFGAEAWGGSFAASLLDIMEHGGHGRLLVHDPRDGTTTTLLDGLNFANGVAVSPDQQFVLVVETGAYRVLQYHLTGERAGTATRLLQRLPDFPDNVAAGRDGRFWVGFVSPRSRALDALSGWPTLRKVVQRLPAALRPKERPHGHVLAFDGRGEVLTDLQDPHGTVYPYTTGAAEAGEYLYVTSLRAPALARLRLWPGSSHGATLPIPRPGEDRAESDDVRDHPGPGG